MAAALSIELLVNIDASPLKMAECCRPDETGSRREANGCSAVCNTDKRLRVDVILFSVDQCQRSGKK